MTTKEDGMSNEQVETPAEFCEWLVSMNALSNVGSRGLVTLSNIIERADLALRAANHAPDVDVIAEVRACGAVWVCHEAEWSDDAYAGTWTCALPLSHGGPHVELTQGIRWHEHGRWSDDIGEFYPPNATLDPGPTQ